MVPHLLCRRVSMYAAVWCMRTEVLPYHSLLYSADNKCPSISLEPAWQPAGLGYPAASVSQHCSWLLAWVATWVLGV